MKSFVKKGDEVTVISGSAKGSKGKVLAVFPKKSKVLVEGVNMKKHHERKSEKNPEGKIIERESPIHISNVRPDGRAKDSSKRKSKKA